MTRPTSPRPTSPPGLTGPTATGTATGTAAGTATGAATYEIRVAGHLDDHWAATLDDLVLIRLDDGTTSLTGPLVDQAQLHGILARIRDLGIALLALRNLDYASEDVRCSAREKPVMT